MSSNFQKEHLPTNSNVHLCNKVTFVESVNRF